MIQKMILLLQIGQKQKSGRNPLNDFDIVSEVVSSIRNFRKQKQIPNKEQLHC